MLLAYFSRFADPNEFSFTAAVDGLVTAVVGGMTLFVGPVLGSIFLSVLPELQRTLGIDASWIRPALSGVLLLAVILFLPGGLSGLIPRRKSARKLLTDPAALPGWPRCRPRGPNWSPSAVSASRTAACTPCAGSTSPSAPARCSA